MDLFTKPWADSGCLAAGTETTTKVATLSCIWPLFSNIINAAIALSGVVALIFIILSGIRIITANGNADQISAARKTLTFAIIGFVFISLSFVIFNFVFRLTGTPQDSIHVSDNGSVEITPPQ